MIWFILMVGPISEPENRIEAPTTGGKERKKGCFSWVWSDLISILHLTWRNAKLVIWNAKNLCFISLILCSLKWPRGSRGSKTHRFPGGGVGAVIKCSLYLPTHQWNKWLAHKFFYGFKVHGWREANQLAIYKHVRGVELGSSKKQLQLSGQSGMWTRDHLMSSPAR